MEKVKASVDYSQHNFTDNELYVKATTIADDLTDNPNFPALTDTVAEIKTEKEIFGGLLSKMADGNKQLTAEKNNARADQEETLRSATLKVQDISKGNEVKILSAGFDINRKPSPVGILDQPVNVQVKQGKLSGSLEVSWDVVLHAYSYEIRYIQSPKIDASVYTNLTSTKHKVLIENLSLKLTFCRLQV